MGIDNVLQEVKKYNTNESELEKIWKAYHFADKMHGGVLRKSGEPYIIHPLHTAIILAEQKLDTPTIMAGLLHDVIEDTSITKEQIAHDFGEEVSFLVDGVTKLKVPKGTEKELKVALNNQKLLIECSKDIRIILIKLADRLHNMRTLSHLSESKRIENAEETLHIYVPMAHMLGLRKIKSELEELAFRWARESLYFEIKGKMMEEEALAGPLIMKAVSAIQNQLLKDDLFGKVGSTEKKPQIVRRTKTVYGVCQRLNSISPLPNTSYLENIHMVHDLHAIKVIVANIKDCYLAQGKIHSLYPYVQERGKDYIGQSKTNGYQSLHTTLRLDDTLLQAQIKTEEMNQVADLGLPYAYASQYKDINKAFQDHFLFSKVIQEVEGKDPIYFYQDIQKNVLGEKIYIYFGNEVIDLPKGSTIQYLAYILYRIDIDKITECSINGRRVDPRTKLEMGNVVTIQFRKEKPFFPQASYQKVRWK